MWRKNRSSPEKGGVCIGVDLNRNFGYRWGGLGTSKQPCREIFAGTGPFSEPETAAMKNFFEASAANFKVVIIILQSNSINSDSYSTKERKFI